jgi:hypothetical protein
MKSGKSVGRKQAENKHGARVRLKRVIFFLSFSDPDLEKRFLARQYKDNLAYNRMVAIAGTVAVSGFYLMNFLLNKPHDILLYSVPYFMALTALCILIALTFLDLSHHVVDSAALLTAFIINAAPLVSLMAYRYPDTLYFYIGCVVLLTASLIFTRLSFYYIAVFAILYVLAFELLFFGSGPHTAAQTWNMHYIFGFVIGVGIIVSYVMELRERTNFVKLRIIVEERIKLSRLRDARPEAGRKAP